MVVTVNSLLAQDSFVPDMIILYWICLIVGGGLLVITVVSGGDADGDLSADIDVDADVDVDTDHAGDLASWISIRFFVYFAAMFGAIGVTLTHMTSVSLPGVVIWSLIGGIIVGQGVHQVFNTLKKNSGDSTPNPQDYVNKLARVTIAIAPPHKGEIVLQVGRTQRFVPAQSKQSDMNFKVGDTVAIVDYRNGIGEVISQKEYEFLNNHT